MKISWKFVNKTDYLTVQLKSIMRAGSKAHNTGPKQITVQVTYARKDRVTVTAHQNGTIEMRLPKDPAQVDKELVACLTAKPVEKNREPPSPCCTKGATANITTPEHP